VANVEAAVRAEGEGVHLELGGIEEEGALAALDLEDLAVVARAHVEAPFGSAVTHQTFGTSGS